MINTIEFSFTYICIIYINHK